MIEPIAMEKYSDSLKDKILFDHFNLKDYILGPELKQLTSVPQINSFVIRRLFDKWQSESEKLKSDYFDFTHEDVQQALKDFLAKLSFHIKVRKDHFEAILKVALHDVFEYLENPIFFLQETFFQFDQPTIQCSEIKKKLKFLKLYANEVSTLSQHEKLSNEEIHLEQFYVLLEGIFENANRQEQEQSFISTLESIIPNNYVNIEPEPVSDLEEKENTPIAIDESENLSEEIIEDEITNEDLTQEIEHTIEEKEVELTISETTQEEDIEEKEESITPLYEKFKSNNTTIYENEKGPETSSFSPIENMADGVSLHQKYFFIKELFNGNTSTYDYVIEKLDEYNSYDDASNFLLENYAEELNWHEKEESVSEFFSILNRRF